MRSSDIPCHHTILTILRPLKVTTILSRIISTDWEIKICYGRPCSINVGLKDIEKPTRGRLRWQEAANFGSCESNSDPGCKTLLSSHMSLHLPESAPYRHMLWGCMRGCKTSLRLPPLYAVYGLVTLAPLLHRHPAVWFYSKHQPKVPKFMNSPFFEKEAKSGQCFSSTAPFWWLWMTMICCGIRVCSPLGCGWRAGLVV